MIEVLSILIFVFLFVGLPAFTLIYYVVLLVRFENDLFETKREFLYALIPFQLVIKWFNEKWKELE